MKSGFVSTHGNSYRAKSVNLLTNQLLPAVCCSCGGITLHTEKCALAIFIQNNIQNSKRHFHVWLMFNYNHTQVHTHTHTHTNNSMHNLHAKVFQAFNLCKLKWEETEQSTGNSFLFERFKLFAFSCVANLQQQKNEKRNMHENISPVFFFLLSSELNVLLLSKTH